MGRSSNVQEYWSNELKVKEWRFLCTYDCSNLQINKEEGWERQTPRSQPQKEFPLCYCLSFLQAVAAGIFFSPLLFIVSISFSSPHFNEQDPATDHPHLENWIWVNKKHEVSLEVWDCRNVTLWDNRNLESFHVEKKSIFSYLFLAARDLSCLCLITI